jgi:hypothetical protein
MLSSYSWKVFGEMYPRLVSSQADAARANGNCVKAIVGKRSILDVGGGRGPKHAEIAHTLALMYVCVHQGLSKVLYLFVIRKSRLGDEVAKLRRKSDSERESIPRRVTKVMAQRWPK